MGQRKENKSMYQANRFHLAVRVYSDNVRRTSKRGKNFNPWNSPVSPGVHYSYLPRFDIIVHTHFQIEYSVKCMPSELTFRLLFIFIRTKATSNIIQKKVAQAEEGKAGVLLDNRFSCA